ncbi:GNAT family N-acetyltransferase [Sphingomonas cannabina]|uniref:GNAT family N-acetyltransferase n=1 Tax=Sphingomonas cannabina TaxID=2899123 RepID=UPI001F47CFDE|nr:GNAT family N-acetyltransferase [Sphingomonas cannabina]UIJ44110.1 GNAT family N-acetyltransferase [Sphingomonas cannabina]
MTLHLRQATITDLPAIVALLADDVNGTQREDASLPLDPGYTAAFAAIAADPDQELIAAEQDGRIVGTLQLSFLPGLSFKGAWRGQIEAVRIAGDLRGQGLGGEMIRWAVERCRQRGCRMVQLTSKTNRADAHRFYEKLGWKKTHAGFKLQLTEDR